MEVIRPVMAGLGRAVTAEEREQAQAFLLIQARVLDPGALARVGRVLRARLRADGALDLALSEDAATTRREARLTQDDEDTGHLSGALDAEGGAVLAQALDPLTAPRPADAGVRDRRCAAQRRADALVQLAETALAAGSGQGSTGVARTHLTVTVSADTVAAPTAPGAARGLLPGGHPISALSLATLACDAAVTPVLLDRDGVPLDVGGSVYAFPERIRAAILLRDGGCTFPGCTRPVSWCQIHHLLPWSQGGATSERNGTAVCGYHHRLGHRRLTRTASVRVHGSRGAVTRPMAQALPRPGGTAALRRTEREEGTWPDGRRSVSTSAAPVSGRPSSPSARTGWSSSASARSPSPRPPCATGRSSTPRR
jgi:hypothetical protein